MIDTIVLTDLEHRYVGINMLGHAGLADNHQEGQELVCSAVSALVLNMANSVEYFTKIPLRQKKTKKQESFPFVLLARLVHNQNFL